MAATLTEAREEVADALDALPDNVDNVELFRHIWQPGLSTQPTAVCIFHDTYSPETFRVTVQIISNAGIPDARGAQDRLDEVVQEADDLIGEGGFGPLAGNGWTFEYLAGLNAWVVTQTVEFPRDDISS